MGILGWILFGFVVGLIARAVTPGRDPMSLVGTTLLGILGAVLAGWVGRALGLYGYEDGAGFISAILGATFVLAIYHIVLRRRFSISRSNRRMSSQTESMSAEHKDTDEQSKDRVA